MPDRLPAQFKTLWRKPLISKGLGGVAANDQFVIVSGREPSDEGDVWSVFRADTGELHWTVRYAAPGSLDYGNSPRATPLLVGNNAFLFGAFGQLHAVDLLSKKILWKCDTKTEFGESERLPWGLCGSPLMAKGRLALYPGGPKAGLAGLDPATGKLLWSSAGDAPGYGSLIQAKLGGVEQIIGYDAIALNGWDAATGKKLWTVTPPRPKDFNVPTPMVWKDHLIVCTENNGARVFRFKGGGAIEPKPIATFAELAPDTHSPVIVGDRLFGICNQLYCLDLANGLKQIWAGDDDEFSHHASIIASDKHLLIITYHAEALLIDATANEYKLLDRRTLINEETDLYSHPAVVGNRLYVRGADAVFCFGLE